MPSGMAFTPGITITVNSFISISSSGLITAITSTSQDVIPSVSDGAVTTNKIYIKLNGT